MSCKGCVYAARLSGAWICDYLSVTGHRRPCPPGEDCTARKEGDLTKKGSAFMKRREWDTDKARALYDQKLSDAEIAGRVGTTASAVAFWRRGLGLPANPGQRPPSQEEPETRAAPPPPASPPSRPLALPPNGAPVELSINLDDGKWALSIRAPNLKGARDIYALAGLVLENMGQIPEQLKEEMDNA